MTDAASNSVPAGRVDRVVVAGLLVATTSLLGSRVFDRSALLWLPVLVVPLALVAVLPAFTAIHRRVAGYAVIGVIELAVVAYLAGSTRPSTLVDAILRGWPRIVSTTWPSPPRPELVVFVALLVVLAAIGTLELARVGRSAAVTLIPATVLAIVLTALAAPAGPVPVWWWLIWVTAALLVLLVGDGRPSTWARLRRVWAERQPVVAVVALLALGAMSVAALDLGDRADRDDRSGRLDPIETLNPLAAVVAERNTSPAVDLLHIEEPPADRWRLFALERYDGISWSVDPVFGPIGRQLSPELEGATVADVDMQVVSRRLDWLPVAGEVRSLDRDTFADPDRSMFRFDSSVPPATRMQFEIVVPDPADADHEFVFDQADSDEEYVQRFRPTAITLAGQATGAEALANIAEAFRTQYRLDSSVPSGANAGILELMLSSSKEGTEEQYVAAFALLADALGARARVAIGYVLPPGEDVIMTKHARAWPEVWSEDAGWVTFDVVPTDIAAAEPEPLTEFDGRAATPPPPLPPPVSTPQEEPPPPTPTSSGRDLLDRILSVAVLVGGSVTIVGLLLGGTLGAILLAKRRRRRRRLAATRTSAKVIGAWAEATDSLVDYGAHFETHHTNVEIAHAGTSIAGEEASESLTSLALLANQAAHGRSDPDETAVTSSIRLLGQVDDAIARRHTLWERLTAVLTARSLRRRTRSPVR